jgi:hypothetical protein
LVWVFVDWKSQTIEDMLAEQLNQLSCGSWCRKLVFHGQEVTLPGNPWSFLDCWIPRNVRGTHTVTIVRVAVGPGERIRAMHDRPYVLIKLHLFMVLPARLLVIDIGNEVIQRGGRLHAPCKFRRCTYDG